MKILFGFFVGMIILLIGFFIINRPQFLNKIQPTTNSTPTPSPFLLEKAPSESLRGYLEIVDNDVLWQSRTASESAKITQNITIQQGEYIETTKTGKAKLTFDKIAKLAINQDSSVDIVQTLPVNLVFTLNKGKINFIKLGKNTISVRSKHLLIQVDGNVEIQSEDEEQTIQISVLSGQATLAYNNIKYETQSLVVEEGQTVIFNDTTREVVEE